MFGFNGADPHVRGSLGPYVLGVLGGGERQAVERHMAGCLRCAAEASELSDVVQALALLPEHDIREFIVRFGAADPTPPQLPQAPPTAARPRRPAPAVALEPAADQRPAGRPRIMSRPWTGRGTLGRGRRRGTAPVGLAVLAVLLVLSVGIALGLTLGGSASNTPPTSITLAATASAADHVSGASLSVFVSGDGRQTSIRATVVGLQDGLPYQLLAVTSDGQASVVARWTGSPGAQDVTGSLAKPANTLAFFTVATLGGTPIVSAYLPRPSAS